MDGIHDLGGKHGFGRVEHGTAAVGFAQRWEGMVFALINELLRTGVAHNVDHFRHAVERIDPLSYLQDGYYGRWLGAAETLLVEAGVLTQQEINRRAADMGAPDDQRVAARPSATKTQAVAPTAAGARRDIATPAKFDVGARVRTRRTASSGHTRLPAYARGIVGEVRVQHGGWVLPDSNAHDLGEHAQHLYTVAFAGETIWGDECEADSEVCLDLFESYLQEVDDE